MLPTPTGERLVRRHGASIAAYTNGIVDHDYTGLSKTRSDQPRTETRRPYAFS